MVKVYLVGKPLLLHGVGNEIKELRVKIVLVIERSQAVVIIVAEAYLLSLDVHCNAVVKAILVDPYR